MSVSFRGRYAALIQSGDIEADPAQQIVTERFARLPAGPRKVGRMVS